MKRRRLLWQLYPSYLLITLLSLLAVTTFSARQLYTFYLNETEDNLRARARLIEPEMLHLLHEEGLDSLNHAVDLLGTRSETRITIIRPDGLVLADSERDPESMDDHSHRPEILAALEGRVGRSSRFSNTLQEDMMYVAAPAYANDHELVAIIRTSKSLRSVNDAIQVLLLSIGVGSFSVAFLAAIASWVTARRISRPLERMKHHARRIAAGDMTNRLPEEGNEEVATLGETINLMLIQLDDRIRIIERQRGEQEAVFSSISDGVLAVDADGLLLSINKAAAKMFDLKRSKVRGRTVREVIHNETLRQFIYTALELDDDELEDEILLGDLDPRYIQAHGRPLRSEAGDVMGAVVVLNDITRLRRLEKARRDFVANVSHELRTPVTSIIGYVETLQEGAKDDPDAMRRFLNIIERQADRLDAIIEDLLSLARIERDAESQGIELMESSLGEVVSAAMTSIEQMAGAKNIRIEAQHPPGLRALINPPLLEQALVNLLSNSIKYSDPDTRVLVSVREKKKSVRIDVSDEGVGIEQEHLPRLFERFYRVDKGRSRMEGGTGLGLAIVKHIALAHGGKVAVDSTVGVGTTFSIILPKASGPVQQLSLLETV